MDRLLQGVQEEWKFIRHCSQCFINDLSDADLDRILPRKGLDTFRKHLEEMVSVQSDYVDAIETRTMRFRGPADADVPGELSKEQLLALMKTADERLASLLTGTTAENEINWFGDQHPLAQHLATLIAHEALHVGQMIAFCYQLGIEVPKFVRKEWALSGN